VAAAFFAPLDFPGPVRRVLRGLRPSLLVLVETELWPNLLSVARAEGVPVCIVNARLAPERMSRYRRLRVLYGPLVRNLDAVGAQDPEQERRFAELGAPRSVIEVTGNMKYDLPVPIDDRASMRRRLAIGSERPVLIAGSTAELEEAPVLDAYQRVKAKTPDALLILAPRRPERFGPAADAVAHRSLHLGRRSEGALANSETDVLLVDVLGELSSLYAAADGAFVGGSLVPVGGHNLLEPASVGVPVAFGPHTGHVEEPASSLLACGGGVRVADSAELARVWLVWATDAAERNRAGNAAKTLLEANRGALRRSVAMVNRILHQAPAGRTA
jgi:3-deoxy-D-manno-octulosonic-acid transferase